MLQQIIALGGGGFSDEPDNPLLDLYFLQQTSKARPKICFMGTATGDADSYYLKFYAAFSRLDCRPTHLSLFKPPTADLASFILEQDAIYVGGGSTKNLLALWRDWELDVHLRQAYEHGVVLGGISAGALCWFEEGTTDSMPGKLTKLACLGFLKGSYSPHYDSEAQRRPAFHRLIESGELKDGLACDDGAAVHFADGDLLRSISSRPHAKSYRVRKRDGEVVETTIRTVYLGKKN